MTLILIGSGKMSLLPISVDSLKPCYHQAGGHKAEGRTDDCSRDATQKLDDDIPIVQMGSLTCTSTIRADSSSHSRYCFGCMGYPVLYLT